MRSPLRTLSVKTRLSLWLALAIVGVFAMLAAATIVVVRTDMQTAVFTLQGALVDSAADAIDDKVRTRIDALGAAARVFDQAQFDDLARLPTKLGDRPALSTLFDTLFVTDANGAVLAMAPQHEGAVPSIGDRDYFRQVLSTDRPVVSPPLSSRADGRPIVVFAAPIHDAHHATIGVLAGILALDRRNFLGNLGSARVGKTGYYFVVSDDGAPSIVAHRHPGRLMEAVRPGKNAALDQALAGFRGTVESVDRDGLEAIHSFRSIASVPWIVAAVYPTEEAYAAINRRVVDIVVGAALMAIVATLGLRWIVQRELEPLGRLRANMAEAASGRDSDIDERSPAADLRRLLRTHNELRRLRAEAESAQREVERRLRDITDHVPALISVFDAEGRYVFANHHFDVVLGLVPGALVGRPLSAVRDPAYVSQVEPQMARALGGEEVTFESHLTVDGDPRFFQETYVPRRGADGAVVGLYAVTFDITERHRARARLAIAERRLRSVTEHLPAIVLYIDAEERYGFVNRHAQALLGGDQEMTGRHVRDVRGEDHHAKLRPWIERALRGETVEFESRFEGRGPERIERYHYVPEVVDGVVCGFFALVFDITALRATEERVRLSEHRLQSITDNVPVLISYVDSGRRLAFVNRRLQDWFGSAPAAALGRPLRAVMGEAFDTAGARYLERAFDGSRAEFEAGVEGEHGVRHLHTVYLPDAGPDGRVQGIFGLTSDVTATRAAERQLQQLARVDTLTGIANRRAFDERLDEAMARCRRSKRPMGLIFLDVDHFKQINDSLGHAGGDVVLQTFASRISAGIRTTDMAARLAGDEFVIVLESLNHRGEAALVADKVLAAIRQPMTVLGQALKVTSSMGVVYYDGVAQTTAAELVARADRALYRGKKAGRDTFAETAF